MKKQLPFAFRQPILVLIIMISYQVMQAQPVITDNDMPSPGDTIRKSTNVSALGIDYTLTGEDYTWDFSELFPLAQTVDTFASVNSVPILYQVVFIPNIVANLAQKFPEIDTIPEIEIIDPYRFFKNTSSSFNDVGLAVTINSIPIPLKYNDPDVLYKFPVAYANADSSFSGLEYTIPNLGYLSIDRKRVNHVDGWGSLTTPYGTFDVIRLKSEVSETDSVYVDSINYGLQIKRNYTEYKWMANGYGAPLLQVYEEGPLVQVSWIDSVRNPITSVPEEAVQSNSMTISPNPAQGMAQIRLQLQDDGEIKLALFNLSGQKVAGIYEGLLPRGQHHFQIDFRNFGLPRGMYFIRMENNHHVTTEKIIFQ